MKREGERIEKRGAKGGVATARRHDGQPAAAAVRHGHSMRSSGRGGADAGSKRPTFSSGRNFMQQGVRKPSARRPPQHQDADDHDDDDDEDEQEDDDMALRDAAGEDSEEDLTTQEQQLADIPFEVLEVLRQDGSGLAGHAARQAARAAQDKERDMHRANRHRPSEMSSKRPVSRFRDVIQVAKRESHDPRFESVVPGSKPQAVVAGQGSHADKAYAFLYEDVIPGEQREVKQRMKKEKNPKFKARLQGQLTSLDQAMRSEEARKKRARLGQGFKAVERQAVAAGKKPFYLKKSEQRRLELVAQYQELKTQGRLDKFMEKRRKKNAAKDHRYVPSQRREDPS